MKFSTFNEETSEPGAASEVHKALSLTEKVTSVASPQRKILAYTSLAMIIRGINNLAFGLVSSAVIECLHI